MALATFTDANQWLDQVKVKFVDDTDAIPEADNAENIVKAKLYDTFPTLVPLWVDPASTPKIVREIASMLMAAFRYGRKYSQQTARRSSYAVQLETRANELIDQLVAGTVQLIDVSPIPVGAAVGSSYFYPNDLTGVEDEAEARMFTVRDEF